MRTNARRGLLLLAVLSALSAAPAQADLPCAWVKYNLPTLGFNNVPHCSPVSRPPGWDVQNTTRVNQPIIGTYYVEVGVTLPLPTG